MLQEELPILIDRRFQSKEFEIALIFGQVHQ